MMVDDYRTKRFIELALAEGLPLARVERKLQDGKVRCTLKKLKTNTSIIKKNQKTFCLEAPGVTFTFLDIGPKGMNEDTAPLAFIVNNLNCKSI